MTVYKNFAKNAQNMNQS